METGTTLKGAGDYVTETDRAAEAAIVEVLREAAPGIAILAEEAGGQLADGLLWAVDPLDGTTNFVHRFPAVGVSIALLEDRRPVVGCVTAPFLGSTFTAVRGGGAWSGGRRLSVSGRSVAESIVSTGFPFRNRSLLPRYFPALRRALVTFEDLRRPGAASLDLAWTAAGVFDGFFELGLSTWDVAAGALLVEEAGGRTGDWSGGESHVATGDILAGTPPVFETLAQIAASRAEE